MASITLQVGAEYTTGTTVSVYNTVNSVPVAPVGSVVTTGVVQSDGTVTFTGLTGGLNYLAYAVSGTPPYVRFYVPVAAASGSGSAIVVVDQADLGSSYTLDLTNGSAWLKSAANGQDGCALLTADCVLTIINGAAGRSARVFVKQDQGGQHSLTVTAGGSSISASGLNKATNGLTVFDVLFATPTDVQVIAVGTSAGTVPASTAPGQPTSLAGVAGAGQVALSWNAPLSNGGSAITDYTVEYRVTGSGSWTAFAHSASASTVRTVTGLSNGTSYDFRVSAVNAVGTGTPSSTVTATPSFTMLTLAPDLWVGPASISALSDGAAIAAINDLTANGNNFTQSTAGLKPIKQTVGGLAVARFDNVDDGMTGVYTMGIQVWFAVVYRGPASGAHRCLNGSANRLVGPYNGFHSHYDGTGFHTGGAVTATDWVIASVQLLTGGSDAWFNGVPTAHRASTGASGWLMHLGAIGSVTNEPFGGDFGELVIVPRVLSTSEHQSALTDLGARWGVTVTPL